jgi:hypothetical protein
MKTIENYKIETKNLTQKEAYESRRIQEALEIDGWFGYKSFASVTGDDEVTIIMFNEDVESVENALEEAWEDYETDYDYCYGEEEVELVGEFNYNIFTEMCELERLVEFKITGLNFVL